MAIIDNSTFQDVLKIVYPKNKIYDMVLAQNVLLGILPKDETFVGESQGITVKSANSQNRSADFSKARAASKAPDYDRFLITTVDNFGFGKISNKTIKASRNDEGALVKAIKEGVDSAVMGLRNDLAQGIFGDKGGSKARFASATGATTATCVVSLTIPSEIVKIKVGMQLIASANSDGSSPRDSGATLEVLAVDYAAKTFTFDDSGAGLNIADLTANDYFFVDGDANAKLSGLADWIPTAAPSAATFFGVDRTSNVTALSGIRTVATQGTHVDALMDGCSDVAQFGGGSIDTIVLNHKDYNKLVKELQSAVQYQPVKATVAGNGETSISYNVLHMHVPGGIAKVIADHYVPQGIARLLSLESWTLHSMGKLVDLYDLDGSAYDRSTTGDFTLVQAYSYSQLSCNAPGHNGVVTLPSL